MVPTWLALCFAVEYCFLLFHVSVAVVVARCLFSKKKPRLFSVAFSVLYLLQSVSDWGSYVFDCVVFRLMQYQVITRDMVLWLHYNRMHYPITSYLIFFQCFVHTAIAANRYTVIAKPLAHVKVWKGVGLVVVVIAVFLLALSCTSVRFAMDVQVIDDGAGGYALLNTNTAVNTVSCPPQTDS
ncbi:hypothetical protein AAVH_18826 [Aphelenchoides avenae]|nr:hypothetical protein AAVH_18826 [Aphelenchus avenae]